MGLQMRILRAFGFMIVAATVLGIGAFIGGTIAQPALLEVLPWHKTNGNKI
jgi:hypothetical protein